MSLKAASSDLENNRPVSVERLVRCLIAAACAMAMFPLGYLTGCGIIAEPIKGESASVVFVTGIHQGSVYPDYGSDQDLLIGIFTRSEPTEVRVFNSTGTVSDYVFPIGIDWKASKTAVSHQLEEFFSNTLDSETKTKIHPMYDGANYIEAVKRAAHHLNEIEAPEKIIYISGNGLSDTGILKIVEGNYLDGGKTPDEIAAEISEQIPFDDSLKGCQIYWNDLGSTSDPQTTLTPHELDMLKGIYTALFVSYGADPVDIHIRASGHHVDYPIPTDKTVTLYKGVPEEFIYDETSVLGFQGDRPAYIGDPDDFKDDDAAYAEISKIADIAKRNPGRIIYITGYMAWPTSHDYVLHSDLAYRRAETVGNILKDLGVENKIVIDDRGNSESTKSDDEAVLQRDRRVKIEF